ncbi:hypothetical protein MNBD_GAMMA13-1905 [hydrothermal vent metagenome]|uniref:Uncharacterized protein n=1 Tax=hydrothermal vent metagenome TaxID=652676 RepID=A0A3B0YTM9_9ZZZZ
MQKTPAAVLTRLPVPVNNLSVFFAFYDFQQAIPGILASILRISLASAGGTDGIRKSSQAVAL